MAKFWLINQMFFSPSSHTHTHSFSSVMVYSWYSWFYGCGLRVKTRVQKKFVWRELHVLLIFFFVPSKISSGNGVADRRTLRERTKLGFCFSLEAKVLFIKINIEALFGHLSSVKRLLTSPLGLWSKYSLMCQTFCVDLAH